jgi:hypothetical protein
MGGKKVTNALPKTTNVGKIQNSTSKYMPGRPVLAYSNYTQHPQNQTPCILTSAISKQKPEKIVSIDEGEGMSAFGMMRYNIIMCA